MFIFINRVAAKPTQTPATVSSTQEPTQSKNLTAARSLDATKDIQTRLACENTLKPTSISPQNRQDESHQIRTPYPQKNARGLHQSTREWSTRPGYHQQALILQYDTLL